MHFFKDFNRKSKSIRNYTLTNLIVVIRRYFFYRCNVHNTPYCNCNTN